MIFQRPDRGFYVRMMALYDRLGQRLGGERIEFNEEHENAIESWML